MRKIFYGLILTCSLFVAIINSDTTLLTEKTRQYNRHKELNKIAKIVQQVVIQLNKLAKVSRNKHYKKLNSEAKNIIIQLKEALTKAQQVCKQECQNKEYRLISFFQIQLENVIYEISNTLEMLKKMLGVLEKNRKNPINKKICKLLSQLSAQVDLVHKLKKPSSSSFVFCKNIQNVCKSIDSPLFNT